MKKILFTLCLLIIVKICFSQTPTPPTNFGTDGSCCASNYTIGVSEATNTNHKLPTIQFHASGFQEAFLRLASDNRVFEIGDNQGVGVGFSIKNPANTVRSVFLSGVGISYFNGGNVGIGTTTPTEKLEVNGNLQLSGKIKYGNEGVRTESRNNAGLQGNAGALSGFYETAAPLNFPKDDGTWWHLLDTRHSNSANNYSMQIAGSFSDQKLFFRKTNNDPAQSWKELVAVDVNGKINLDNDVAGLKKSVTIGGYVQGGAIRFNANSVIANNRNLELGYSNNTGVFYPSVAVSAENGNVGIGTTNPAEKLSILHNGSNTPFGAMGIDVTSFSTSSNALESYYFRVRDIGAGNNIPFIIKGTGSVGIGTTNPISALQTNGTVTIGSGTNPSAVGTMQLKADGIYPIANRLTYGTDGTGWKFAIGKNQGGTVTDQFVIQDNGNISIGITTAPAGYKLAIAGDMIAERVVVKLQSNWPDYVFNKNYGLRPLELVEQFINQNNHLPEVPSAQEVTDKGIDVGAMNAKLLQKVEELTLYLIEQNKEIKALKNKVEVLEKK